MARAHRPPALRPLRVGLPAAGGRGRRAAPRALALSRKPQDGVPRGDYPPTAGRPRMLHGMSALARAAAAAAGQSRVGLRLVAGAGSDRRAAPALPGELTGSRNSLRIA